jgi:predicted PurR-regulated permease PerM
MPAHQGSSPHEPEPRGEPPRSFAHKAFIAISIAFGIGAVLYLTVQVIQIVLLVFAGVLLALFLRALTGWLMARTGLGNGVALGIVLLGLVGIVVGSGWLMAPSVIEQGNQLRDEIPRAFEELREDLDQWDWGREANRLIDDADTLIPDDPQDLMTRARTILASAAGGLVGLLIITFVGIYLAADPGTYRRGLLKLVSPRHRDRANEVLSAVIISLKRWLVARIVLMVIVGVLTYIGLWAFGVPMALVLAILAALLEFIPNIGPMLAALPAILIAWTDSPTTAIYVALLYVVIQQLESFVLVPIALKEAVKIPPALTITTIVAFGILLGPLGVLLASPMVAAGLVLLKKLYVEDTLGDRENEEAPTPFEDADESINPEAEAEAQQHHQ